MAPKKGKKEGGGKKAGKASKLAKMNEQERVKYLGKKIEIFCFENCKN